jgi:hypothetical protein
MPVVSFLQQPHSGHANSTTPYESGIKVNRFTHDIVWTSDVSGYLGEGNHCTVFLPEGLHHISAEIQSVKKENYINVLPAADSLLPLYAGKNNGVVFFSY